MKALHSRYIQLQAACWSMLSAYNIMSCSNFSKVANCMFEYAECIQDHEL